MTRTTVVSLIGIGFALVMAASCMLAGLAVRVGAVDEVLLWFPPDTRYQMIVRVGRDAMPSVDFRQLVPVVVPTRTARYAALAGVKRL